MPRAAPALLAALFVLASSCPAVAEEGGWRDLFDGQTLEGWEPRGGNAEYRVEDGAIVGTTVQGSPNTFLCTEEEYGDFILTFEVKVDPELNSGVQIRSHSRRHDRRDVIYGYQVEIDPSPRAYSGGLYDEARRGWLKDLSENEAARKAFKNGDRHSTIMQRIAKGYSDEEIALMATVFAKLPPAKTRQMTDPVKVAAGQVLHDKHCAKCHDENGALPDDDAGILASQWAPYLKYSLMDAKSGAREVGKKMKKKVDALSDADIDALVHFYASQQ